MKILIVGHPADTHVGHHFLSAALEMGVSAELLDVNIAFGDGLWQKMIWRFDRLPSRRAFFEEVFLQKVKTERPDLVLVTGIAPLGAETLLVARKLGVCVVNFLTDDPWNPAHRSRWFLEALPKYERVFSPRRSNLGDLSAYSENAIYLPFAYNPHVHFVEHAEVIDCDVLFVGGADADRVPFVQALLRVGLSVWAYGGYWDQMQLPGLQVMGKADSRTIRRVTSAAKVNLILVRRANRDGHVMRSFEAAASGGCLILEDTCEHRELFEEDGVKYFKRIEELPEIALNLVADPMQRELRKGRTLENIELQSRNTYRARLMTILQHARPILLERYDKNGIQQ